MPRKNKFARKSLLSSTISKALQHLPATLVAPTLYAQSRQQGKTAALNEMESFRNTFNRVMRGIDADTLRDTPITIGIDLADAEES